MTDEGTGTEALQAAFLAAGLDPTGIDLAWLAGVKEETERKIASYRTAPGFTEADPAFNPLARADLANGETDGAA